MVLLRNLLLWLQHQNRNRLGIRKANNPKGRVLGLLGVGECSLAVRRRVKLGLTNATGLPVGICSLRSPFFGIVKGEMVQSPLSGLRS